MKTRFGFVEPGAIMGVVVALIILAVGVFAFFTVTQQILDTTPAGTDLTWKSHFNNRTRASVGNVSNSGDSVFNIVGVVLIIGAIMSIVGLVYNYVR